MCVCVCVCVCVLLLGEGLTKGEEVEHVCMSVLTASLITGIRRDGVAWRGFVGKVKTQSGSVTWTVFLMRREGPGYSLEYRSVRKRELMSVDLPNPDSPTQGNSKSKHTQISLFSTADEKNQPPPPLLGNSSTPKHTHIHRERERGEGE